MALEQIAAGLFNFDPTRGLATGTQIGASAIQAALQEQAQKFQVAANFTNAQLQNNRNDLSLRTQMFNEMTDGLNRIDKRREEAKSDQFRQSILSQYGDAGSSSSYQAPLSLPESAPSPVQSYQPTGEAPQRSFSLEAPGMFNTSPNEAPVSMGTTPQAQVIQSNALVTTPIGAGIDPVQAPGTSFNATSNAGTSLDTRTVQGSASARMQQRRSGRSRDARDTVRPRNDISLSPSFATESVSTPQVTMSGGVAAPVQGTGQPQSLPTFLETDSQSRVDPVQLHGFMEQRIANSRLNGFVPRDGERFGITDGSPSQWADYFTGLARVESGFNTQTVGDRGRFPGNSNGLFQLSPQDSVNHGIRNTPFNMSELQDPTFNADAAVKITEGLVLRDGVIAEGGRGAARYFGPLRRGVRPQTQSPVSSTGQRSGGLEMPSQQGGIDAGLFPTPDLPDLPEASAVLEARAGLQRATQAKTDTVSKMQQLRQADIQVELGMRSLNPRSDPLDGVAFNQLAIQSSRIKSELAEVQQQNQANVAQERMFSEALLKAESSLKIAQDMQSRYQQTYPQQSGPIDRESMVDAYVEAPPLERIKMKARFSDDQGLLRAFSAADSILNQAANQTDARTWKIGGSEYSMEDIINFYQAPGTLSDPNPVRAFVDKDPKLKEEVLALLPDSGSVTGTQPADPSATAPTASPSAPTSETTSGDPVISKIDELLSF